MTFGTLHAIFIETLQEIYPHSEARNITRWVWECIADVTSSKLLVNQNEIIPAAHKDKLLAALEQLKTKRPVQYVLGEAWFYGLRFRVNESVLIPRPETEELVEWVIKDAKAQGKENGALLDIGTGSGCIAISIKYQLPKATVTAIDISEAALAIASENAHTHACTVDLKKINALDNAEMNTLGNFDVIVSNPPYIAESESASMHENVLKYEPSLALFVPNEDALLFYRHIAAFAKNHLSENGKLYFEINENLGAATAALLKEMGFNTTLRKDAQGKDRMLACSLLHGSDRIRPQ